MAHSLACPQCRTKLLAPSEIFGETVRCTKCGTTFTASPVHSPYLEGLPPPPKNRRPLILGGAVLAGLAIITGLILGINGLSEPAVPETDGMSSVGASLKAIESVRTEHRSESGPPIEIPAADGPDRLLLAAKKPANELDDVALLFIKWEVAPDVRLLKIGYTFQNGASPSGRSYVVKLKFNGGMTEEIPINPTIDAAGIMKFTATAMIPEGTAGRLPKVEAWIELTTGIIGKKVSNIVSTE